MSRHEALAWPAQNYLVPKCLIVGEQQHFCLGLRTSKRKTRYAKNAVRHVMEGKTGLYKCSFVIFHILLLLKFRRF